MRTTIPFVRSSLFLAVLALAACSDSTSITAPPAPTVSSVDVVGTYSVTTRNEHPLPLTSKLYNDPTWTFTILRQVLVLRADSTAVFMQESQYNNFGVIQPVTSGQSYGKFTVAHDTVYLDVSGIKDYSNHDATNVAGTYRLTKHDNQLFTVHSEIVFTRCDTACYIPPQP